MYKYCVDTAYSWWNRAFVRWFIKTKVLQPVSIKTTDITLGGWSENQVLNLNRTFYALKKVWSDSSIQFFLSCVPWRQLWTVKVVFYFFLSFIFQCDETWGEKIMLLQTLPSCILSYQCWLHLGEIFCEDSSLGYYFISLPVFQVSTST